jgi:hypothetical protein
MRAMVVPNGLVLALPLTAEAGAARNRQKVSAEAAFIALE